MSNRFKIKEEEDFVILFDDSSSSFSLLQGNIEVGSIKTRTLGSKMWLDHVYIDPKLRGRKLGELLVLSALSYLEQADFDVVPVCNYAKAIIRRKIKPAGESK